MVRSDALTGGPPWSVPRAGSAFDVAADGRVSNRRQFARLIELEKGSLRFAEGRGWRLGGGGFTCMHKRAATMVALAAALGVVSLRGVIEAQAPPASFHLVEATIDDIHAAFGANRLTCRALVEAYLRRIEAYDKVGPRLNAVQTVNPRALQEADRLDAAFRSSGPAGPLHCIPVLVKDQVETSDMPTTYGSILFKDFVPQRDATVVAKLRRAGAVIVGKSTMGEYAAGYLSTGRRGDESGTRTTLGAMRADRRAAAARAWQPTS